MSLLRDRDKIIEPIQRQLHLYFSPASQDQNQHRYSQSPLWCDTHRRGFFNQGKTQSYEHEDRCVPQ